MSLLESLFGGLGESASSTAVEHPCSNCPTDCEARACAVCQPYKEKLIDAIYNVEHADELLAKYEVVGSAGASSGNVTCPYCGGPSADPYVCEYCGMQIAQSDGKIRVASASDIPNPILDAQDLIYDRYAAVAEAEGTGSDSGSSGGLLSGLLSALTGTTESDSSHPLGAKMTEEEIREAAALYGVSVSAYLTGLDSGKYLTLSGKKAKDSAQSSYTAAGIGAGAGLGAGMAAGAYASHSGSRPPVGGSGGYDRPQGGPPSGMSGGGIPGGNGRPQGFDRRPNEDGSRPRGMSGRRPEGDHDRLQGGDRRTEGGRQSSSGGRGPSGGRGSSGGNGRK